MEFLDSVQKDLHQLMTFARDELCALTHTGATLFERQADLEAAVERNCLVRVILCAPDDATVNALVYGSSQPITPAEVRERLWEGQRKLARLARDLAAAPGRVLIKTVRYVPAMSIYLANPGSDDGRALTIVSAFRTGINDLPSLRASKAYDPQFFAFVQAQFELHWNAAESVNLG